MRILIKINGLNKGILKIRSFSVKSRDVLKKTLISSAIELRTRIIDSMQNTKIDKNKKYPRQFRTLSSGRRKATRWHSPSKEGSPPAIDTGALAASIIPDVRDMEIEIGSSIGVIKRKIAKKKKGDPNYPVYLEKGTNRMKARPWMEPNVRAYERIFIRNMEKAVGKAIDKI